MEKLTQNPLSNLPYFPVCPCPKSATIARALHACYLGKGGALSALLQYFTDAQQCMQAGDAVRAARFTHMAHIKLVHLSQLAALLDAYGGNTALYTTTPQGRQPWTTATLAHHRAIGQLYPAAYQAECATATQYRRLLTLIDLPANQAVVERLLTDVQDMIAHCAP